MADRRYPGPVARLATSCASTQLNLGYLIQQSPGSAQRGAYRGSGFELRTDAWAVIRGGEGVLISTSARSQLGSGVSSTQMDAAESVSLFKSAQALATSLGDAAAQQQALFSKDALRAQADFIEQIDPQAKGKLMGAVGGQEALKARPGSRELEAGQPVEKFGSAIVLMDAAANMNWATPASTVIYAGQQLQWTAQSDLHFAAAHTVSAVAGGAASLFTHSGGIQAIAGNGPVSLQAHTDQLEILADKEITVISVNDCIEIKAKEKIVLQAGQSAVTLEGGDITFACPGKFSVKGGKHLFDKGNHAGATAPTLPDAVLGVSETNNQEITGVGEDGLYSLRFAFAGADEVANLFGLQGKKFNITDDSGALLAKGYLKDDGRFPRLDDRVKKQLTLELERKTGK